MRQAPARAPLDDGAHVLSVEVGACPICHADDIAIRIRRSAIVNNARENGQAQAVPIGAAPGRTDDLIGPGLMSDTHVWIPPAARDDAPRGRRRWLTKRLNRGLAGVAILPVGAAVRYWRANTGFVKTDNAQTYGDLAPSRARSKPESHVAEI
jgi:hypothetical protein